MIYLIGLTLLATASAMCPGESPCSGHGNCGTFDRCSCHRNYQGQDCSERTCPFEISFNDVATEKFWNPATGAAGDRFKHIYTECSSKGECDRSTGTCKCYDGFTGAGCKRMSCDNDCSGHGTCHTLDYDPTYSVSAANLYSGWDKDKISRCECDPGYEGTSCQNRKCKRGDDPMTLTVEDSDSNGATTAFQVNEVQHITISTGCDTDDEIYLTHKDWRGSTWKTWVMGCYDLTPLQIKEALEAMPNMAIPSISVTGTAASSGSTTTFTVTFTDPLNSGDQPLINVKASACSDIAGGCQPLSKGSSTGIFVVSEATKGTEEFSVCSNRGSCDGETGLCECFEGFTGEACHIQTVIT